MSTPTFSVVLPVYNGERYLRACLDSVLGQTFDNFELVIVDDASRDSSQGILDAYHDDWRVRIFRHETNQGLFPTLNEAIQRSRAPLIHLLGQDDQMKRTCLERWNRFWKQHPAVGMAYCQRDIIDETGTVIQKAPDDGTPTVLSTQQVARISLYHGSMPGNIASVVLARRALDEVGLFREDMKVSGDFEMWVRMSEAFKTGFCNEALIKLRRHSGQFSRQSGVNVRFMEEDREIIQRLIRNLPPDERAHATMYNKWYRHVQYVHYMVRALLQGDTTAAYQIYERLRAWDSVPLAIGRWLITGNNRWRVYRAPS